MNYKCLNVEENNRTGRYYSIYLDCNEEVLAKRVFTDKNDAFNVLKLHKNGRLKSFADEKDAIYFSEFGSCVHKGNLPFPRASYEIFFIKGPKIGDLIKFKKAIEENDKEWVIKSIRVNPRYLVGRGDTPLILQEDARYNALHIVAKTGNVNICKIILNELKNPAFYDKLYGFKENSFDHSSILLDLYLNTPDKSLNETPLHFASKFGALEIVKILVLQKECDRFRQNKFGQTAMDIACTKNGHLSRCSKEDMQSALLRTYFLPVLNTPDMTFQPVLGVPFTPSQPPLLFDTENKNSLPLKIHALVGPMTEKEAIELRKVWIAQLRQSVLSSPGRLDPFKFLEAVGRQIASSFKVPWIEYWRFLDIFEDLRTVEGLNHLENYLKDKLNEQTSVSNLHQNIAADGYKYLVKSPRKLFAVNEVSDCINLPVWNLSSLLKKLMLNETEHVLYYESYLQDLNDIVEAFKTKNIKVIMKEILKFNNNSIPKKYQNILDGEFLSITHHYIAKYVVFNEKKNNLKGLHKFLLYGKNYPHSLDWKNKTPLLITSCSHFLCVAKRIMSMISKDKMTKSESTRVCKPSQPILCECTLYLDSTNNLRKIYKYYTYQNYKAKEKVYNKRNYWVEFYNKFATDKEGFEKLLKDCWAEAIKHLTRDDLFHNLNTPNDEKYFDCETEKKEIFLEGDVPTRLDAAVLESISTVDISQNRYPFVYYWKSLCNKYSIDPKIIIK